MGYHFLPRWLCVFGLIPRWGNSSSNRWFIILSILWKKRFESGTYSEELQGLTSCTHTVFALLEGSIEKNCFKMQRVLLLFLYGTKSRENNWPNGQPAQCMTLSEFYKKTGTFIIGFCVYVFVVVRRFATDDVFVYLQLTFWIFPGLVWLSFPK